MREVIAAGFRFLEFTGAGSGRERRLAPTVLFHGFAGRAESWRDVAAAVAPRGPLFAVDLPGHGPLSPVEPEAGFDEALAALARALAALHGGAWRVVGYSMGARVALALAVRGLRAEMLTLIGVHPGLAGENERDQRRRDDALWARLLRDDGLAAFVAAWEVRPLFASQSTLPATVLAEQRRLRLSHDAERLARALEALGLASMPDCRPALPRLDAPVVLVAGERDEKFAQIARSMLPLLPHGRIVLAKGAGHNVVLERPGFVAALLNAAPGTEVR